MTLFTIIVLCLIAGLAMPAGALLARIESIKPLWLEQELRHSLLAFGGGALLSAVALVLVPDSLPHLSSGAATLLLFSGGLAFMALDRCLAKHQTPAGQLAAMLSDFIPEAMALGAAFALHRPSGFLLAGLIALQNLPEGFNAFRELANGSSLKPGRIILYFSLMALLGPVAGVIGFYWLAQQATLLAGIMLLASGGILYSVFQDIAPQVPLQKHWAPPMGAVLGFMFGMLGYMLSQH
ncbi:divalent cation transporter [Dasania marina]|uniref:ZIP family metal transporter n=1 Tax=Dasania marina TaxID=471499 RepID=UPI0030DC60C1|tara:strand:- start:45717 stop:46430 length:714 start_codon:yes stop_codon:yes gene_type:complete